VHGDKRPRRAAAQLDRRGAKLAQRFAELEVQPPFHRDRRHGTARAHRRNGRDECDDQGETYEVYRRCVQGASPSGRGPLRWHGHLARVVAWASSPCGRRGAPSTGGTPVPRGDNSEMRPYVQQFRIHLCQCTVPVRSSQPKFTIPGDRRALLLEGRRGLARCRNCQRFHPPSRGRRRTDPVWQESQP
jgi:hypothetical protein